MIKSKKINILITGSSGFIGSYLLNFFSKKIEYNVTGIVRNTKNSQEKNLNFFNVSDIGNTSEFEKIIKNTDVIVHTAGIAHNKYKKNISPYHKVNTESTINLCELAAKNNVKKFIFLSTIRVYGENNFNYPLKHNDYCNPESEYAISKYNAEKGLIAISKKYPIQIMIIRMPLVYGPGVGANFLKLIKLVDSGFPIPLKNINNKKSFISIFNLIDFIELCISIKHQNYKIFLISDMEDISTTSLLSMISLYLNKKTIIFNFPKILLKFIFYLSGKNHILNTLFNSCYVDNNYLIKEYNWNPKFKFEDSLRKTINFYKKKKFNDY